MAAGMQYGPAEWAKRFDKVSLLVRAGGPASSFGATACCPIRAAFKSALQDPAAERWLHRVSDTALSLAGFKSKVAQPRGMFQKWEATGPRSGHSLAPLPDPGRCA